MKAMVFAAGLGTRLRPLTDDRPKALVEVGGRTMLSRVIGRLKDAGVDEIVVNVHHFPDMIIDYLDANDNFGVTIHVSDERGELLDTGGGILKARRWLDGDEPFIVHNADILTDFDLGAMLGVHKASNALATLLVAERTTSRYILFDNDMRMCGWANVKTGETRPAGVDVEDYTPLAFGGVHVISPAIFPLLERYSTERKFSIMPFYIDSCGDESIQGYTPSAAYSWHDIGSPAKLAAAEASLTAIQ